MKNLIAKPMILYGKVPFKYIYFGLSSYVIVMCGFFVRDRRGELKENGSHSEVTRYAIVKDNIKL